MLINYFRDTKILCKNSWIMPKPTSMLSTSEIQTERWVGTVIDDQLLAAGCQNKNSFHHFSIMTLTTSGFPGSPRTSPGSRLTPICTETCLSGLGSGTRPGRAPAPAQTPSQYFFRSPEMRKVTRGLRDKLSNKVNILLKLILGKYIFRDFKIFCLQFPHSQSTPVNPTQCLFRSWVERSIISEYFSR